ncbi:hypothetical protein L0Y88_16100 [Burkholderia multivorans]|uniref:hypothetical protein n=1 Tax=Burkholderia multivorans TaxID=87883 RepID=UPI002019E40C|nr:hypothetical protein [Burkholderia multivorans]UQN56074.1 hypothetical protein L0Y88_16100 [Burkholderia multivorans]
MPEPDHRVASVDAFAQRGKRRRDVAVVRIREGQVSGRRIDRSQDAVLNVAHRFLGMNRGESGRTAPRWRSAPRDPLKQGQNPEY